MPHAVCVCGCRVQLTAPDAALRPDMLSHQFVALAHIRAGELPRALTTIALVKFVPGMPRPNAAMYTPCMATAAAAGDTYGVVAMWKHMISLGVPPDDETRLFYIDAASFSNDPGVLRPCRTLIR